jgi:hypothetical protein
LIDDFEKIEKIIEKIMNKTPLNHESESDDNELPSFRYYFRNMKEGLFIYVDISLDDDYDERKSINCDMVGYYEEGGVEEYKKDCSIIKELIKKYNPDLELSFTNFDGQMDKKINKV